MRTIGITALGVIPALLIGGCATVPPRYSYYQVPCATPGAVLATPVAGAAQVPVAPGYPAPAATAAVPGAPAVATCVIAVVDQGYGYYGSPYYGRYGYGGYGPYGYGGYGSLGLGFGFSSHHSFSGGHHSSSGSHSGGHTH
ncbi:MAG: hypothetical protein V4502_04685 [Pseudomonadota bacterium]